MLNRMRPTVFLPIDAPPRISTQTKDTVRGIKYVDNPGVVMSPIRRPFSSWVNNVFPWVAPSNVAPDAVKPAFGYSTNDYSPVFHRATEIMPVPVTALVFKGKAKGSQRVTGKSVPYPFAQPRYPQLKPSR